MNYPDSIPAEWRVLLVTGSREFDNRQLISDVLGWSWIDWAGTIRHGDCPTGADRMAREWCENLNSDPCMGQVVKHDPMPADWKRYGKTAGIVRNIEMLDKNPWPDMVAAFLQRGAKNSGTRHTIGAARARDIYVMEVWNDEA